MFASLKSALFLLTVAFSYGRTMAIEYLDSPELAWSTQLAGIRDGNAVATSPDDVLTVVTQSSGAITAFDTFSGEQLWEFTPPSNSGLPVGCQGGVTFATDGFEDFLVYSVVDDPIGITSFTRVISLSYAGELRWISTPLEGAAAGSPLASFDGRYIYLTHNSNAMSVGHFSVLDSYGATVDTEVLPLYTEFNRTNPFSPPGIFHRPEEGYYDGGLGNTNDIVVWSFAPNPLDTTVGTGATFVFQFPIGYVAPTQVGRQSDQDPNDPDFSRRLFWIILGGQDRDWQSVSAPVLTNMGRSIYWSVSRSQFRSWVGAPGVASARFNRIKTGAPSLKRGSPRYAASPNTPALSSSTTQPMIFAGSAANEFVKMNYLMDDDVLIRNTTSSISARAIVSPDDQYVYYTEFTGILHQASTEDLVDNWNITGVLNGDFGVLNGEFAMTSDGSMIILGDVTGKVNAYRVAVQPTPSPTVSPSVAPTSVPQPNPTNGFRPTLGADSISGPPSFKPTRSPIFNSMPTTSETQTNQPIDGSAGVLTNVPLAWISLGCIFALLM